MPKKNTYTLVIEKLVPGGFGLGRLKDGMVVLVRSVLPGEKVVVRETGRKKDYRTAALLEVLHSSPDRVEPPCPIYGRCGGCDLQHAGYDAQLRLKQEILADSLQRAATDIVGDTAPHVAPPLPSPLEFGYRQRLRLQVDRDGRAGFFQAESHIVEPVAHCLLVGESLNETLGRLQASGLFTGLIKHCGAFELLFNPADKTTLLLLHYLRRPRPADSLLVGDLRDNTPGLSGILMQVSGHGLYDPLSRTYPPNPPVLSHTQTVRATKTAFNLSWEVGGFCQVNLGQNSNLVDLVLNMTADGPHDRVLDLYCGYGNFSLPVSTLAREVLGIDAQNSAIRSARHNALRNSIHNCSFEKNQVPEAVTSLVAAGRTFQTIILDPPRRGAAEILALLPRLGAERIVYISCNPATLARDLATLTRAGYQLSRLVPVDMFPQTHHLESVALMQRAAPV